MSKQDESSSRPFQLTIRGLMLATFILAVAMALMRVFPVMALAIVFYVILLILDSDPGDAG